MPSLFLSHSSADKTFVEKLAKDLEGVGVNVWFDKWEIKVGDSLTGKIEEGLQANDYLGLVLSTCGSGFRMGKGGAERCLVPTDELP